MHQFCLGLAANWDINWKLSKWAQIFEWINKHQSSSACPIIIHFWVCSIALIRGSYSAWWQWKIILLPLLQGRSCWGSWISPKDCWIPRRSSQCYKQLESKQMSNWQCSLGHSFGYGWFWIYGKNCLHLLPLQRRNIQCLLELLWMSQLHRTCIALPFLLQTWKRRRQSKNSSQCSWWVLLYFLLILMMWLQALVIPLSSFFLFFKIYQRSIWNTPWGFDIVVGQHYITVWKMLQKNSSDWVRW